MVTDPMDKTNTDNAHGTVAAHKLLVPRTWWAEPTLRSKAHMEVRDMHDGHGQNW